MMSPVLPNSSDTTIFSSVLREPSPVTEAFVTFLWQEQCFDQAALRTLDGRPIRILKQGHPNVDAGPDYERAEIVLDGELYSGAVELHLNISDWWSHGHQENPAYSSVILHVALWDDSHRLQTDTHDGPIPSLALYPYLDAPLNELIGWWREERADLCPLSSYNSSEQLTLDVLEQLGQERMLEKIEYYGSQMLRSDIEQVCYGGILDALGYSANREPFRELGRRLPLKHLMGKPLIVIEALLFGAAGLLPAQTGEKVSEDADSYVTKLEDAWYNYSDAPTPMRLTEWKFARLRPPNLPTRRIAGMARLIDRCQEGSLLLRFLTIAESVALPDPIVRPVRRLRDAMMPQATGFWLNHSRFGGRAHRPMFSLVGASRASDIVVNVLLPVLGIWAVRTQSDSLSQSLQQLYDAHPPLQSNHITRQIQDWLRLPRQAQRAKIQQGMIYLYRLFCITGLCGLCPVAQAMTPLDEARSPGES